MKIDLNELQHASIREQIEALGALRASLARLKEEEARCREAMLNSPAGKVLAVVEKQISENTHTINALDNMLRTQCVQYTERTGDKHPHEAVTVKEVADVEYEEGTAIRWAITHNHAELLKLNKTAFKKVAKAMPDSIEGVTITTSLKPYIATDLTPWAKEPAPEEARPDTPGENDE